MAFLIPQPVESVIGMLNEAGYEAYAVGGCVRDLLMGKAPSDWDLTTDALPGEIHQALAGVTVLDTGLKHGTVTAVLNGMRMEITTYRVDGNYSDHRRPDSVTFTRSLREDLARRDFTVNAMVLHPQEGVRDFFGGRRDLEQGLLRTVGRPEERFQEDALRIMRGLRFAATLGFTLEEETAVAMERSRFLLREIAPERLREELCRLLTGGFSAAVLRRFREIFAVILPEVEPMFDFDQRNPHHIYDVWEHSLHAVEAAPPELILRLTMLLHDCAKPACFSMDFRGHGHFYGHAARGAQMAEAALERLRFEKETARRVVRLIKLHDSDVLNTEKSLLRWLRKLGEEDLRLLMQVKIADNLAQNPHHCRIESLEETRAALEALLAREPCFDRSRLAVKGGDLMALGLEGPALGRKLDELVEAVIEGRVENRREALLAACREEDTPPSA